jgi:hypothetical protein
VMLYRDTGVLYRVKEVLSRIEGLRLRFKC